MLHQKSEEKPVELYLAPFEFEKIENMGNQIRFVDKLRTFFNSWTVKIAASCIMAFLVKVFSDSSITALFFATGVFFAFISIFDNNITSWKKWVSIGLLIVVVLGGGLIWWIKYHPRTFQVAPGTAVNFKLTPRNSKFFVRTDIAKLRGAQMRLGIVPFGDGDKLLDVSQSWVSSRQVIGDPLLYSFDFSKEQFDRSARQVTMAFLLVEWNGFPSGFMPLVFYSWNYTEGKDWAMWRRDLPDQIFDPDQSDEVQRFINNVSACMIGHSKDKEYDVCFK
ncbi:MAG: hypothetical protein ABH891_08975 [Candidatus Omnitrophota bacterium]